jgi:hypothetical protein
MNTEQESINTIKISSHLKPGWIVWFNGMLIATEGLSEGNSVTTFTCKVRDQAELIGIINWLHNMKMVIEMVCLVTKSSDRK